MAPGLGAVNGILEVPPEVPCGDGGDSSRSSGAIRQLSYCSVATTVSPKA